MWPFKRKPKHVGPKTVDWQPGDMAETLPGANWKFKGPKTADKLMVTQVRYGVDIEGEAQAFFLCFLGYGDAGYYAGQFRKITLTETGADRKVGKRKPVTVHS